MASQVEIYNVALSHIGDTANVAALGEASVQGQLCDRFYPGVLRKVLSANDFPWTFAKTRATLNKLTNGLADSWDYKYALPNLLVTPIAVLDTSSTYDGAGFAFEIEGDSLYTHARNATMLYVFYQDNTGKFSASFTEAVSRLLASRLAGPRIKGAMGRQERDGQFKGYLVELGLAQMEDANRTKRDPGYAPGGIAARGGYSTMELDEKLSEYRSRRL